MRLTKLSIISLQVPLFLSIIQFKFDEIPLYILYNITLEIQILFMNKFICDVFTDEVNIVLKLSSKSLVLWIHWNKRTHLYSSMHALSLLIWNVIQKKKWKTDVKSLPKSHGIQTLLNIFQQKYLLLNNSEMATRHAARILFQSRIIQRPQNLLSTIVLRNYSDESKKEELVKVTHTGQVQLDVMWTKY